MNTVLPPLRYTEAAEADFHHVLNERAKAYLAARNDHRFAGGRRLIKALFLALACVASYLLALQQSSVPAFVGAYVATVFFCMLLNIDVNHDASHNVFLRSRLANRVVGRLVTLLLGIDPDYWRVRHTDYHHAYPNIEHYDLDTEENGFFRQTPFQRWRPHMRWQHRYWPLMAAMSLPYIAWVFDWQDRLGRTALREKNLLPGATGWLLFIGSKLGHLALALVLPLYAAQAHGLGWQVVVGTYLTAQMAASLFVVFMLLGTHWAQASFYQAPADGVMPHGWYAHNFATACDWFPEPRWLQWIMGGLNLHLTHHLFPGWHHRHYEALAAIVADTAKEFGLSYRCLGYRQLLRAQQDFLQSMGRAPEAAC
jgi:linoleoyl-CoA desaturase